jgi:hypothetical protein
MAKQIWSLQQTSYPARRLGRIRLGGLVFVFNLASGLRLWWALRCGADPRLGCSVELLCGRTLAR